jgi:NADPH-dependent glutamate synthase beta subunit-like oxidoreductase
MPAAERVKSYAEVSLGLTPLAALEETSRCLRCDVRSVER